MVGPGSYPKASWYGNSGCWRPRGRRGARGAYPSILIAFSHKPSPKESSAESRAWGSARGVSTSRGRPTDLSVPLARERGLNVHGHTIDLVLDQVLPSWALEEAVGAMYPITHKYPA